MCWELFVFTVCGTLCFLAETVRDRKCRTSQLINVSLLRLCCRKPRRPCSRCPRWSDGVMEGWSDGGMEDQKRAQTGKTDTHRKTKEIFFFLYIHIIAPSRRPLVEAGGNATRCDLIPDIMSFVSLDLYIKWEQKTAAAAQSPFYFVSPVCIYISTQYILTSVTLTRVSTTKRREEAVCFSLHLPRHPVQHVWQPTRQVASLRNSEFGILSNRRPKFGHLGKEENSVWKKKKKKGLSCCLFILFCYFSVVKLVE